MLSYVFNELLDIITFFSSEKRADFVPVAAYMVRINGFFETISLYEEFELEIIQSGIIPSVLLLSKTDTVGNAAILKKVLNR